MRPLIIGTAKGYQWKQIEAFAHSFVAARIPAEVVLFVDRDQAAASREKLTAAGITAVPLPRLLTERSPLLKRILHSFHAAPLHRWLANRLGRGPSAEPAAILRWLHWYVEFLHIACARYLHYYALLAGCTAGRPVLLTDVRDVLFQADPFPYAPSDGLLCSLETQRYTLLTQDTNRRWLDFAFGRPAWEPFANASVSCSGTTLGSLSAVRDYAACMSTTIIRLLPKIVGQDGLDQGIHNYVLYSGMVPHVRFAENLSGPFATLHGEDPALFGRDPQGRLLNSDGRPVPVLHQIDRHPALQRELVRSLTP
jgi:hypothetical protein